MRYPWQPQHKTKPSFGVVRNEACISLNRRDRTAANCRQD